MGTKTEDGKLLFDFETAAQIQKWRVINDGVMGGISSSSVSFAGPSSMVFSGEVSLENYGGFCSAGLQPGNPNDLSSDAGICLRIKGDGHRCKVTLKNDTTFGGFVYQYDFETRRDEWVEVQAPFTAFKAVFRGTVQPNAGRLDPSRIMSLGFIISDKQAGPFRLEIDWIKAFR